MKSPSPQEIPDDNGCLPASPKFLDQHLFDGGLDFLMLAHTPLPSAKPSALRHRPELRGELSPVLPR
jgi:hypothetical protein